MKILTILIIFLNSALVFGQEAEFSVLKPTHKFKKTNEGKILTHYFVFENTGKSPLIISSYQVACHCTVIEFPTYPIAPGQKDSIKLTFNTNGKYYQQDRIIVINANTKKKENYLRFKVYVIPKED